MKLQNQYEPVPLKDFLEATKLCIKSHIKEQIVKVALSLNFIGSPYQLYQEIREGYEELEEDGLISGSS